ncbi:gamma-glutamyltransferase [bacterium]|nr:gamma-glutamyltransferase [bacterium]
MIRLFYIVPFVLLVACGSRKNVEEEKHRFDESIVVSAHQLASEAGAQMIKKGGNAADAAIATNFALAVTYPVAGNLGGGGFAVIRHAGGHTAALDFRETAPDAYTDSVFLDSNGNVVPNKSLFTVFAAGVPGSVEGMWQLHQNYANLEWSTLLQPAISLAQNGFALSENQAKRLNYYAEKFTELNDSNQCYLIKKRAWQAGDTLIQPELAAFLNRMAKTGRAAFYEGTHAKDLVKFIRAKGGLMKFEDLKNYRAVWREPYEFDFNGHHIISMPLPSSGGVLMHQILRMAELMKTDLRALPKDDYIHLLAEFERRAFADRSRHLGDPDFWDFPIEEMIADSYLLKRIANINMNRASNSDSIFPGNLPYESMETTHFSVVDHDGFAISITTTINAAYGSGIFVPGYGYLLNNEMDDFSAKAGVPNMFGLLGSDANAIKGEKRPLSSMSPTIITQNGQLKAVTGSPGGSTIITTVLQSIINLTTLGYEADASVGLPRFHHQWKPDVLVLEQAMVNDSLVALLTKRGHVIDTTYQLGNVNSISVNKNNELVAGADKRAENAAVIIK